MPRPSNSSLSWIKVDIDSSDYIECRGYRNSTVRFVISTTAGVLSLGLLFLVFYWKESWKLKCLCRPCKLEDADYVLIKDMYQRYHVSAVQHTVIGDGNTCSLDTLHSIFKKNVLDAKGCLSFFKFQKIFFIWDPKEHAFFRLRGLESNTPCSAFFTQYADGQSERQSEEMWDMQIQRAIYGDNDICVSVRSIPVLLFQEILNPFYIFQIFSVTVWMVELYIYYSACILILSALSIGISLYKTRKENLTLHSMVQSDIMVKVLRPKNCVVEISEKLLVPGDVIVIPHHGCMMTCDAVLISGNCIVNESALTGESVPVTKTPLPNNEDVSSEYCTTDHKRHSLFCGTRILQTREGDTDDVRAVVVQTGFSTAKGFLVRAIMYPKPMEFKLYIDLVRFVAMLGLIGFFGIVYTFIVMSLKGVTFSRMIIRALDIVTIAVMPALPAALTIGMIYAQIRLKAKQIFCISPQRINLSGTIDVFCFDKTGTLTEDGLDLMGIQIADSGSFLPMTEGTSVSKIPIGPFLVTMATCHSLAVVNKELSGDPIDLKMFQATGWSFTEPDKSLGQKFSQVEPPEGSIQEKETKTTKEDPAIPILRQFPFSSALQRMSVIVQSEGGSTVAAYVKGSPEMIASLSKPETVPEDFYEVLSDYTQDGFRVLALAWKDDLPTDVKRKSVETELTFLGLMIMENKLKPETKPVIEELNHARIRTVMITGDNLLTAVNIARSCGMCGPHDKIVCVESTTPDFVEDGTPILKYRTVAHDHKYETEKNKSSEGEPNSGRIHYAMDGATFDAIQKHYQDQLENIIMRGTIFARFSPGQKAQVVEELQHLDYFVGMCGDGANDCGALKTAHAGISLSEAEASVASPFTSKIQNISCVPILIREGRAALVTSFSLFKFMALYSIIQFLSIMILYSITSTFSDLMFHYIDLFLCTLTIVLLSRGEAFPKISAKKPLNKLLTTPFIFSLVTQLTVVILIQTATFLLLRLMPWYVPPDIGSKARTIRGFETTALFLISCFQYIVMGVVFTPQKPYRQPLNKLYLYSLALMIMFIGTTLLLYVPSDHTLNAMKLVDIPDYAFKSIILALGLVNLVLACIIEYLLVPNSTLMRWVSCTVCRKVKQPKYTLLEMESPDVNGQV